LIRFDKRLPTFTLTGETLSLDAAIACRISNAHGYTHDVVRLGGEFLRRLPDCILAAGECTGGPGCVEQSAEVHYYHSLPVRFRSRISGFLGNQIGRRGMEQLSARNADSHVFSNDLRKLVKGREPLRTTWRINEAAASGLTPMEFLLHREVPFAEAANYAVGQTFSSQISPYADRTLVELSARRPRAEARGGPLPNPRLRDLAHRFLGEPSDRSFQRRFVKREGGFVARYPINWGWRADGGVSIPGMISGSLAAADAYGARQGRVAHLIRIALEITGLAGLHEYRRWDDRLKGPVRHFLGDMLTSRAVRDSGLFDNVALIRAVDRLIFRREGQVDTLIAALEVAVGIERARPGGAFKGRPISRATPLPLGVSLS
jgi:hypothetical protein